MAESRSTREVGDAGVGVDAYRRVQLHSIQMSTSTYMMNYEISLWVWIYVCNYKFKGIGKAKQINSNEQWNALAKPRVLSRKDIVSHCPQ